MGPVHRLVPVHRLTLVPSTRTQRATPRTGSVGALARTGLPEPAGSDAGDDGPVAARQVDLHRASANPAARAAAATVPAWCGASSTTSDAGRASQAGAAVDQRLERLEPGGPGDQGAGRLPVGHLGRQLVVGGHVGRVADDEVDRAAPARPGRASNHEPSARRTRGPRRPRPARLARATASASAETSVAHTSTPVALGGQRQGDGARAGAEVDGDRRRGVGLARRAAGRARPGPSRPPPRSRAAGSAPGGRRTGRGCGTPSCPSTYCSGSPASRRATMRVEAGHAADRGRLVEPEA